MALIKVYRWDEERSRARLPLPELQSVPFEPDARLGHDEQREAAAAAVAARYGVAPRSLQALHAGGFSAILPPEKKG